MKREVFMNDAVKMIFGLMGGLALFLFGMNSMSENLQKVAGDKMKKILAFLTGNPVLGALAGTLVTAVLQSSSATTVMAIGFVSAGLMSLPQAISVIFGANIGTTMTAQLMAFKISNYIYPIIFIGFLLNFICKQERIKNLGTVIFSFGLLFEGIEIMGDAMKPLAGSPVFTDLIGRVAEVPLLGVMLGTVMTLLVQSSSATIAVLQNFASQAGPDGVSSVIGLTGAIPILLGDNIGTTITALLASIGQSKNAKRAALAHSIFNISGSVVFLCFLSVFAKFVTMISPKGPEVEVISRQIANAHTTFNVICTLVWLPLIPLMVKLVTFLVRGKEKFILAPSSPQYLEEKVIGQPVVAMYLVSNEISHCAGLISDMMTAAQKELIGKESDPNTFDSLYSTVKKLQEEVVTYISRMFARGGLTEAQAERTAGLLFVINNMDRVADRFQEIVAKGRRIMRDKKTFSNDAKKDISECFHISGNLFNKAVEAVSRGDREIASETADGRKAMRQAQKKFNKAHLARVKEKKCDASLTQDYTDILYCFDRVVDNCVGMAEEVMDGFKFVALEETGGKVMVKAAE